MGSPEPFPSEQGSLLEGPPPEFPDSLDSTEDAGVDALMAVLIKIPDLVEAEQPAAYERLHDELLAELNTEHG